MDCREPALWRLGKGNCECHRHLGVTLLKSSDGISYCQGKAAVGAATRGSCRAGVKVQTKSCAHHQSEPPQISPTSTDHHRRSTYFHLLAISRLVNPGLSTAPSIFRPPSPFPHSRVFPNMELRGAASSKGSPDTRSILTSTMAKISTGTSSPRKSSFLQLQSIPPPLRPLVRAYLLGYASAVLPRLLTLVLQHLSNRERKTPNYALPERDENTFLESAKHVLKTGLDPCRFPTFCAALVGGATLLQVRRHFYFTAAKTSH